MDDYTCCAKRAAVTPTDRTRAWYTNPPPAELPPTPQYTLERVERWVRAGMGGGYRRDMLHLFDFIGLRPNEPILGIQSCGPDFKAHYQKMTVEHGEMLKLWMSTGSQAELIGWRKLKSGWTPRIHRFTLADFE